MYTYFMVQTPKASKTPQRAKTTKHRIIAIVPDMVDFLCWLVGDVTVRAFEAPTIGVYPNVPRETQSNL
jgi:hypothetical protein